VWALLERPVLKSAWTRFTRYDALASRLRRSFERLQIAILALGMLATLAALLQDALPGGSATAGATLHWAVVAIPILTGALVAFANRFSPGKRWVLLRAAAEMIKREIYRSRTGTGPYGGGSASSPEQLLAERVGAIDEKLMQSEASAGAIPGDPGPLPPRMYGAAIDDDGLTPLGAERYLAVRIGDQVRYYRGRAVALARRLRALHGLAIAVGASGAVLAAAGHELWVGLTGVAAAGILAHLGHLQIETTLVAYNQAAARLESLEAKWRALPEPQRDHERVERLVARAESALEIELGGWVQQMNDSLEDLAARQPRPIGDGDRVEARTSRRRPDRHVTS
jgi:hypothetical protein